MNTTDPVETFSLSPRACVLGGTLLLRTKNNGALPAQLPHYARGNCPPVLYEAHGTFEPIPSHLDQAEIEFNLEESPETMLPSIQSLFGGAKRPANLLTVAVGRSGLGPSMAELRMLREAGQIMERLAKGTVKVYTAVLPILIPGEKGVPQGRFYVLGVFSDGWTPIWVNPAAIETQALKAPYPDHQIHRSTQDAPRIPVGPDGRPLWYHELAVAFEGVKGKALQKKIFEARARFLVNAGQVGSVQEGVEKARAEYEGAADLTAATHQPSAPPPPSASRRALLLQK